MDVTSYLLGKKAGGGGITPTGTISITQNGETNVTNYATANVNVQPDLETKSVTITENTTTTITPTSGKDGLSSVAVTTNVSGGETLKISAGSYGEGGYNKVIEEIPKLQIEGTSCSYMFAYYTGNTIPILEGTANVTDMSNMFLSHKYVTIFNLDNYDTSNVTNMASMFETAYSNKTITRLDLSHFDTSSLTKINRMFYGLVNVAILDISNFVFSTKSWSNNNKKDLFVNFGRDCLQSDGAYADGIPYVYVKDANEQNWVLTTTNLGVPATWTTDNVVIKSNL